MGIGSPALAAPYDISGLNLSGLGGFGGGRMGGVLQNDPNQQYITAPISNKGNPTGKMGGNVFVMTPDQPVRLVDLNTKTVVFEGTGYDAGKKATELGQNLTDTMGRKASYDIQTADPSGKYTTVANEKFNKSTLGTIGEIAGTLAPIAASFIIPGLGLTTLGSIGASAGVGGLSAALKGDNILKGAALGGLGAAGGAYLGPAFEAGGQFGTQLAPRLATAIGTGLGSTAGGLVTGQNLKNSLLGGVASGAMSYLSPDITKSLGIGGTPSASGGGGGGGTVYDGISVVGSPAFSPGLTLGGSQNKIQRALSEAPYNGLTVTGNGIGSGFGFNFGGNQFGAPGADTSALDRLTEAEMDQEEIDVLGNKIIRAAPVSVPVTGDVRLNPVVDGVDQVTNEIVAEAEKLKQATGAAPVTGALDTDIVVNALGKEKGLPEGSVVAGLPITGLPKMDPSLTEKTLLEKIKDAANLANAVSVLVPLAGGVLGGGGGGGTMASDTTGLNFTTNPLRPTTPGTGIGGIGGRYPYTPTTYGRAGGDQETEYMFFTRDPVTGAPVAPVTAPATAPVTAPATASVRAPATAPVTPPVAPAAAINPMTIPVMQTPTATITAAQPNSARYEEAVLRGSMTPQERALMRLVDQQQAAAVNPGATLVKKEGGEVDDDMVKHLVDYHKNGGHRGPGQVKGIGSGQEDKIPAYLSDGEYVWSAQDVSDLGDGSNREGVRRLDEMRKMVRQQAGRKDVKKIAKPQKGIDRMLKAVGGMA
jgi:hypothetical protein